MFANVIVSCLFVTLAMTEEYIVRIRRRETYFIYWRSTNSNEMRKSCLDYINEIEKRQLGLVQCVFGENNGGR